MKAIFVLLLLLNSAMVMAISAKRSCPAIVASPTSTSLDQFSAELRANNISVIPGNVVQPANVDMFLQSYRKFPQSLRTEMVGRRARISIMEGEGVKTDPSFTHASTFDGRDWSKVPGSGGEVSRHHNIPTRIVVNSLTHNHGSMDLVLHEHAHTLDSIYGRHELSKSGTWHNLIAADPSHIEFMRLLNGDYTAQNPEEAFAESFAYYFSCEATRTHMEEEVPQLASFFQNLTSVKNLLDASPAMTVNAFVAPALVPTPTTAGLTQVVEAAPERVEQAKEECLPDETKQITDKISPLTRLTPFLKNYPIPGAKPNAFQVTYPVYPNRNSGASAAGIK